MKKNMKNPEKILPKMGLLLVEGADEKYFFIRACDAYGKNNIQVMDFGGITDLPKFLEILTKSTNFPEVKALAIVRDAETDASKAIRDIQNALKSINLPAPKNPFEQIRTNSLSIEFGIFPGQKNGSVWENGALEDLCLKTISNITLLPLVKDCVNKADALQQISHKHKALLHTWLSVNEPYIGMKIGEAAQAGAWNWQSQAMMPFKNLMQRLDKAAR